MRSYLKVKKYHIPIVGRYFLWLRGREPILEVWSSEPFKLYGPGISWTWQYRVDKDNLYRQKSRTRRQRRKLEELRRWYRELF